ncbi:sodium-coupled neutral amino acid transporter 7-like [Uloborus diversus]|uniref:sodium-coupled neutral amino acid transporter 7-like n=1 Tax=Uloborus diversus TaxID=327109 RepID=UPI002409971F|nr:sodium-coupled neutral amino acid transporter 7-like [Uloborus diversus]
MTSLEDLSTNLLWQSFSKDVYSQGKYDYSKSGQETILEVSEIDESKPLLQSNPNSASGKKIKKKGAGWLTTAFLIVNTALGIGILNFPAAYDQAGGILYATCIQLIMVCLMMSTMFILAYCSDVNGDKTYHDVLLSMTGKKGQRMAAISITLTLYCVCVAILIIIGDQIDSLFSSIYGPGFCNYWYLDRCFTIPATAIFFILPTCFCKRVDFLAGIGSIGIFAMLYPVFLTVYGYFKIDIKPSTIKTHPDDLTAMLAMLPVLGLGYQCQEVCVPIYSCMKDRNLCNFAKSSFVAMGFLFVIYSITGCFGYLTFGSEVAHNVMKMYNAKDPFVMVGVGALILKMIVTYPILALCGRDATAGIYAEIRGLKPVELAAGEKSRRYVFAAIWFTSSLFLAVVTSGIGIVIKYLGSVASANIFIYPGICLMKVVLKEDPDIVKTRSKGLIVYSIFIAAVGAFCFGEVLLTAILNSKSELPDDLCVKELKAP